MLKKIFVTVVFYNFLFTQSNSLTFLYTSGNEVDVILNNSEPVYGFQFEITGATISSVSGGSAIDAGFTVSAAGSTVLGFSFTGSSISANSNSTLVTLILNDDSEGEICFNTACWEQSSACALSNANGEPITTNVGDCISLSDCSSEIDCNGECGGNAVLDTCGICNGNNLSCSPISISFGDIDIENKTAQLILDNSQTISSLIFTFSGMEDSLSFSGGRFESDNIIESASNDLTVQFSGLISVGNGLLVNVNFSPIDTLSCISGVFALNEFGNEIESVSIGECTTIGIDGCMVEDACNYNSIATFDYKDEYTDEYCSFDAFESGEYEQIRCTCYYTEDINGDYDPNKCDCNGNVIDDCSICGGENESMDECGICGGAGDTCANEISGCTQVTACNYNSSATFDDGSCAYIPDGNGVCCKEDQKDCQGICFGEFEGDECGECIDGIGADADATYSCVQSCADGGNEWFNDGSGAYLDECGECIGDNNGFDIEEGYECFRACDGNWYNDLEDIPNQCLSIDMNNSLPSDFRILNTFPNPFNPQTTIEFELDKNSHIQLLIIDIHGKIVKELLDGFHVIGKHKIIWKPNSQPSGIYFVFLYSQDKKYLRKIAYIK